MIIKKIPIKTLGGVKRTIEYIASDKGKISDYHRQSVFQNILSTELEDMAEQFKQNFTRYSNVRNKTVANHIILAYSPLDKDKLTIEKLDQLAEEYLSTAFPDAISFASHHMADHRHTHLLVSGNDYLEKQSTRQTKQVLKDVHLHMLDYMEKQHGLTIGINREAYGKRQFSEAEYYQKVRNPRTLLDKDELATSVQGLFRVSESIEHFKELLQEAGYSTYDRQGQLQGVYGLFGGQEKRLRFGRLGIERSHLEELRQIQERMNEIEQLRDEQEKGREIENSEID